MTVPTLADVFGPGATQNATTITIAKADLPTLTPSATNTAQQLLAAILLKAGAFLTPEKHDADPDAKIEIAYSGQSVVPGTGGTNSRQDTYSLVFYKTVPAEQVDADDY